MTDLLTIMGFNLVYFILGMIVGVFGAKASARFEIMLRERRAQRIKDLFADYRRSLLQFSFDLHQNTINSERRVNVPEGFYKVPEYVITNKKLPAYRPNPYYYNPDSGVFGHINGNKFILMAVNLLSEEEQNCITTFNKYVAITKYCPENPPIDVYVDALQDKYLSLNK